MAINGITVKRDIYNDIVDKVEELTNAEQDLITRINDFNALSVSTKAGLTSIKTSHSAKLTAAEQVELDGAIMDSQAKINKGYKEL